MSNSTFFKLGDENFVLHGYDTERDLKRAERDVKRTQAYMTRLWTRWWTRFAACTRGRP